MTPAEIGAASAVFFLGFAALFVLGLKTGVPGRFPVSRSILASAVATAAAWTAGRFGGLHPAVGLAVAFGLAAAIGYRPPWWSVPLVAGAAAGFHFLVSLAA